MVIQRYLVEYILEDKIKHNNLLSRLDDVKWRMCVQD